MNGQFLKVNVGKYTLHLSVWVRLFHLAAGDFGVDICFVDEMKNGSNSDFFLQGLKNTESHCSLPNFP